MLQQREQVISDPQQNHQQEEYDYSGYEYDQNIEIKQQIHYFDVYQMLEKIKYHVICLIERCGMQYGYTLMLFSLLHFSEDNFHEVIDSQQTGQKMVKYNKHYKVESRYSECSICNQTKWLCNNSCGHQFCLTCWINYIKNEYLDQNKKQLFPLCPQEGCFYLTNYYLIQFLWSFDDILSKMFQNLLCLKYSQKSYHIRICPNLKCGCAIDTSQLMSNTIECICKYELCKICRKEAHYPLDCHQMRIWKNLINIKNQQYIQNQNKKCPMCKTFIEKVGGCIKIKCICQHVFCWNCLKVWKGHQNLFQCNGQFDDELASKKQAYQIFLNYSWRTNIIHNRILDIQQMIVVIKTLNIQKIKYRLQLASVAKMDIQFIQKMKQKIIKYFELIKRLKLYYFFQNNRNSQFVEEVSQLIKRQVQNMKYYFMRLVDLGDMEYNENQFKELRQQFIDQKKEFLCLMNNIDGVVDLIKDDKILLALEQLNMNRMK